MSTSYFVGVDVGSSSVRAALVSENGKVIKTCVKESRIWKPKEGYFEQSSTDIWDCCIHVIQNVVAGFDAQLIKGIGFDATCSLVALDKKCSPISISDTGNNEQNIIMWMDHRAKTEAAIINKTNHDVLKYVGGKVSLEMEIPKLLWLKRNYPKKWSQYGFFFDLPDFLTWKATGSFSRSLCSLVCKWNYECTVDGNMDWNKSFFNEIGLEDVINGDLNKIGSEVLMPGSACGKGLSLDAAKALSLLPGTPVATSMIDAHAGGLGMIGARGENVSSSMSRRLGLICGTSTCHMAVNDQPIMAQGVWGPYYSAMIPGTWLNEGGQSASGMLIDHVIESHPAGSKLLETMGTGDVRKLLRKLLLDIAERNGLSNVSYLTNDFHIWPDFHGNRSPLADPTMKGMVVGLTINKSNENLALMYLATMQALAYGTRHIMETLLSAGYKKFEALLICGGLSKDPFYVQIQADAVGIPLLMPHEKDSVLIGSAILGACASRYFTSINEAIDKMGGTADVIHPNVDVKEYHNKKYGVFIRMFQDQIKYRNMMAQ